MNDIVHVVGARPNFPKLAPVYHALARAGVAQRVVHTGQHYDDLLSDGFFRLLDLPEPDTNLGVGSAGHAVQTARIMEGIDPVLNALRPRWVVVYGDVNSTAAAALVAVKLGIQVAHVEAGLRSFDRTMPEEINRLVTDRLSALLLTPSRDASDQLRREGEPEEEIAFVGNVMIDSLCRALSAADAAAVAARYGVGPAAAIVTLHRPSNVDDPARLTRLAVALSAIARERPVFFAAHPRAAKAIAALDLDFGDARVHEPVPYLDMLALVRGAGVVITDSGGLQEETTVLGVPCLTVRPNTERPITIAQGTNRLVPEPDNLPDAVRAARRPAVVPVIEGWDGIAGTRVAKELLGRLG